MTAPALALETPPLSPATGHREPLILQGPIMKRLNDLFHLPAYQRNNLDSLPGQQGLQRPGNRATHQDIDPQIRKPSRPRVWCCASEVFRAPAAAILAVEVDQKDLLSDIKHRRNPALPGWYGHSHAWD